MREQSFFLDIINRFNYIDRIIRTAPYTLGGSSGSGGGSGGPPGGFIGQLPQRQVAGDTTESFLFTSGSNATLIENLNNIRAWLLPTHNFWANTQDSDQLYISSGSWYYQNQSSPLVFTGGFSPALSAPTGGDRYDLLIINHNGILDWVHGSISATPVLPSFPDQTSGSLPLWVIYSREGGTTIERYDDGTNHYIYGDYRPFISTIGTGGPYSSGSSLYQWYVDGPLSSGSGVNGVYYTPSNVTASGVDLFLAYPNTSGSTIIDLQYSADGSTWTSLFASNPYPTLNPGQIMASFVADSVEIPIYNVVRANITDGGDASCLSINFRGLVQQAASSGSSLSPSQYHQAIFTIDDQLQAATGGLKLRNRLGRTLNIYEVFCEVDEAPTGNPVTVDINKNGTTIFTNQGHRPSIAAGTTYGSTTLIDVATWANNEYLTMDIDQVGTTDTGSNLVVTVVYQ